MSEILGFMPDQKSTDCYWFQFSWYSWYFHVIYCLTGNKDTSESKSTNAESASRDTRSL